MTNTIRDYLQRLKKHRSKRCRGASVLLVLSLLVAAGVSWQLHLTGITMTGDLVCGYEEHQHSEACYENQLVCAQEASDEHTHTDACYEDVLVCEKPEHTHDEACYSSGGDDDEVSVSSEPSLPECTGDWAADVAAIAQACVDFEESPDYTAWYQETYEVEDEPPGAAFAAWCLDRAEVDSTVFPYGVEDWAQALEDYSCWADPAETLPEAGDLVFLEDAVGIVTDTDGEDLTVVAENEDGQAEENTVTAEDVTGVGLLPENPDGDSDTAQDPAETEDQETDPADASDSPEETTQETGESEESQAQETTAADASQAEAAKEAFVNALETADLTPVSLVALINSQVNTLSEGTTPVSLTDYLADESHKGTITLLLMDENEKELTKNASGNYEVQTGQTYKLKYDVSAPSGVAPGTYTAQLPTGITYTPSSGNKITTSTGTEIGTWSIDSTGKITFVFNDKAQQAQNLRFTFTTSVAFAEADKTLDFDGDIKIEVKQPPDENPKQTYNVSKYKNGDITNNTINWQASVVGDGNHKIVESTITDTLSGTNQTMEKQNITLVIWENEYYSDGSNRKYRHKFTISENDPNLTWTEDADGNITGWTYTVPKTLTGCEQGHDEGYQHTDDAKTYTVKETDTLYFRYSTKIVEGSDGPYTNSFTHGDKTASYTTDTPRLGVVKTGGLDADAGVYKWHLELSVPKVSSGGLLNVSLRDREDVLDTNGDVLEIEGKKVFLNMDFEKMKSVTVTATYTDANEKTDTVTVPKYTGSESLDVQYVYKASSWQNRTTGQVYYYLDFYKRCDCTEGHCAKWKDGKCDSDKLGAFCRCFNGDAVTFKVDVEQDASEALEYHGLGYKIDNYAWAQRSVVQPSGDTTTVTDDQAEVKEDIPGVFTKENIAKPGAGNGWMASFQITVNEGKADLSKMENGVTIEDQMSTTLVFNPASLKITATDKNGTVTTLTQGTDYTVEYDTATHKASIHIPKPGACQYTLDYSAAISVSENDKTAYSNKASVTLLGHTYEDEVTEVQLSNWAASAYTYRVSLYKTAADKTITATNGKTAKAPLAGATFGLFNADGTQLASGTTDANGSLTFETNTVTGLIFYPDTAYYIQETKSPDGYNMDTTKAWFYFSSGDESKAPTVTGATFTKIEGKATATGTNAPFQFTNTTGYTLPSTGGSGTLPYVLIGLLLTSAAVVGGYKGRKQEGRREH